MGGSIHPLQGLTPEPQGRALQERSTLAHLARETVAIVLAGGRGAKSKRVVIDQGTTIPAGLVAGHDPGEDRKRFHVTDKGVTLITPAMLGQYKTHLH